MIIDYYAYRFCPICNDFTKFSYNHKIGHSCCINCDFHGNTHEINSACHKEFLRLKSIETAFNKGNGNDEIILKLREKIKTYKALITDLNLSLAAVKRKHL
jgi:hypothetical protein